MELVKELGFKKLPTRTEFDRKIAISLSDSNHKWQASSEYRNLLQQKPELWMFVPAIQKEGVWVVLKAPEFDRSYPKSVVDEYQEALDRVLFDGFEVEESMYHQTKREIVWAGKIRGTQIWSKITLNSGDFDSGMRWNYSTLEQAVNNGIELKLK